MHSRNRAGPGSWRASLRYAAGGTAVLAMLGAGLVFLGWAFEVEALKSVSPGWVSMKVNAAICFLLSGSSLWLLRDEWTPKRRVRARLGQALAGAITLAGTLTLGEYAFQTDLGIDQLWKSEPAAAPDTPYPGRMSPITAASFVFLGLALLGLDLRTRLENRPSHALALPPAAFGLLCLAGYVFETNALPVRPSLTGMAAHSALMFMALSLGLMCSRPSNGLLGLLTSEGVGGAMARRLLPFSITLPLLLGWVGLMGERAGLFSAERGLMLFATSNVFVFSVLIWGTARSLNLADRERREAVAQTQALVADLDRLVNERTAELLVANDALTDFKLALDQHAIVAITDARGKITYANDKFCAISKYAREELLGQDHRLINSGHHPRAFFRELWRTIAIGRVWKGEIRNRAKDGAIYWVTTTIVPLLDEKGKPAQYIAIRTDITERKHFEERIEQLNASLGERARQLEEANKELEAFSNSVSHDLRAPLRHIQGYVEMLTKSMAERLPDRESRYLKTILEASQDMGRLIDDLLAFSRMARVEMSAYPVSMDELVAKAVRDLEMETRGRSIVWKIASLPSVIGDPAMLLQVLANLLGNAVKYTRRKDTAQIEIGSAGEETNRVILFVRDNGAGFDMKYAHKLFGVFQRLHGAEEFEGTGIGLATVRRVLARHGGRVWAEALVSKGATFYFTLEAAGIEPQARREES